MNCMDLLAVAVSIGFGFYFGKDFYSTFMQAIDRAGDKTESHRLTMGLLAVVLLCLLVYMFITVELPIENVLTSVPS